MTQRPFDDCMHRMKCVVSSILIDVIYIYINLYRIVSYMMRYAYTSVATKNKTMNHQRLTNAMRARAKEATKKKQPKKKASSRAKRRRRRNKNNNNSLKFRNRIICMYIWASHTTNQKQKAMNGSCRCELCIRMLICRQCRHFTMPVFFVTKTIVMINKHNDEENHVCAISAQRCIVFGCACHDVFVCVCLRISFEFRFDNNI